MFGVKDMRLKVNGKEYETKTETILQLLREMEIMQGRVAIEVNLDVIKKTDYENYRLQDGDNVEIVYFVGGGNGR